MNPNLPRVQMQLVGLDGNAFSILGAFKREARNQGWDKESIDEVIETAMSGDYNHLLTTILDCVETIDADDEYGDEYFDEEVPEDVVYGSDYDRTDFYL